VFDVEVLISGREAPLRRSAGVGGSGLNQGIKSYEGMEMHPGYMALTPLKVTLDRDEPLN
jgi:hypothetical protein